ncbi:hypothetical protein XPA_002092 [Xanthoria parietina]
MSTKRDMRREDLIIPYAEPPKEKNETDISSTMSSTLPMAAMFTRNKYGHTGADSGARNQSLKSRC